MTLRKREILQLIAEGKRNKDIAEALYDDRRRPRSTEAAGGCSLFGAGQLRYRSNAYWTPTITYGSSPS
jgi:hypothetical protein